MNQTELNALTALGALPQPTTIGLLPITTAAKTAIGHARIVNVDGSITVTAFCFDGSSITTTVPA